MKNVSYLKTLHDEILAYTKAHDDLSESHHWLFDLPPFKDEPFNPKHIVFGINPGEGKDRLCPTQTEETRFFDFHEEYGGQGSREKLKWTKKLFDILETRRIIQTELIFWSTKTVRVLNEKFGPLKRNHHLDFCCKKNKQLIEFHKPDSIICPGLQMLDVTVQAFGLKKIETIKTSNGHRLIEHYDDGKRDWVFAKHFTGARDFTNEQKNVIKSYIQNL
jgi:hypothetical protein